MFQWEKISHTVMFNIKFTMIDFNLKAPIFIGDDRGAGYSTSTSHKYFIR